MSDASQAMRVMPHVGRPTIVDQSLRPPRATATIIRLEAVTQALDVSSVSITRRASTANVARRAIMEMLHRELPSIVLHAHVQELVNVIWTPKAKWSVGLVRLATRDVCAISARPATLRIRRTPLSADPSVGTTINTLSTGAMPPRTLPQPGTSKHLLPLRKLEN